MRNYKIAVAGTGYVGLSLGVLLSQHHQVVAVDIVQAKVDMFTLSIISAAWQGCSSRTTARPQLCLTPVMKPC